MSKPRSKTLIIWTIALLAIALAVIAAFIRPGGAEKPVQVSLDTCEKNRVTVKIINPTDSRVQAYVWISSGNQLRSTATGEVEPHTTGTGFGGFSGSATGGCTITSLTAYTTGEDGNTSVPIIAG